MPHDGSAIGFSAEPISTGAAVSLDAAVPLGETLAQRCESGPGRTLAHGRVRRMRVAVHGEDGPLEQQREGAQPLLPRSAWLAVEVTPEVQVLRDREIAVEAGLGPVPGPSTAGW